MKPVIIVPGNAIPHKRNKRIPYRRLLMRGKGASSPARAILSSPPPDQAFDARVYPPPHFEATAIDPAAHAQHPQPDALLRHPQYTMLAWRFGQSKLYITLRRITEGD